MNEPFALRKVDDHEWHIDVFNDDGTPRWHSAIVIYGQEDDLLWNQEGERRAYDILELLNSERWR